MFGISYGQAIDFISLLSSDCFQRIHGSKVIVGDVIAEEFGGVVAHITEDGLFLDTYHNSIARSTDCSVRILKRSFAKPGLKERAEREFKELE